MASLNRPRSKQRRRRRIQAQHALITSAPQKKGSLCQEDDHSQGGERSRYSGPNLPEDIWCHIHSLMPLRDSARSASVSWTFLRAWRCHPKLIFTDKALGLEQKEGQKSDLAMDFASRLDHILKNHSCSGVKILKLVMYDHYNVNTCHVTSWLQNAITPGIEEVTLFLPDKYREKYNFPCSVLRNGRGNSIQSLHLAFCAFLPTLGFDCLRSLTKLDLYKVRIAGDELGCLLSNSFALEKLRLSLCDELICLKIPFWLERLSCLDLTWCKMLQMIKSAAPNLSTFGLLGDLVQISLGKSSQVKKLHVGSSFKPNIISHAITKLPSITPHVETLTISSMKENINIPIVAVKFLHLKYLKIFLCMGYNRFPSAYDYLSLVSFLDASPLLETCIKYHDDMKHDSVLADASHMRQIPGHMHDRLKKVQISGFFSAKSMVELTCHILENATSLFRLTVDTIYNAKEDGNISRCCVEKMEKCSHICRDLILEAHKALWIIKSYILGRVPSTVKLDVGEPCSRCHAIDVNVPQLFNI